MVGMTFLKKQEVYFFEKNTKRLRYEVNYLAFFLTLFKKLHFEAATTNLKEIGSTFLFKNKGKEQNLSS